jgi:hypothetical protein
MVRRTALENPSLNRNQIWPFDLIGVVGSGVVFAMGLPKKSRRSPSFVLGGGREMTVVIPEYACCNSA